MNSGRKTWKRRSRTGLMATTALQAGAVLFLAVPAQAQPAPTARPQGGAVVGGQASIAQTTAQTTIAQSTQRAAIDWRSYDIGQAHTVTYQQPNASSITLNRVTGPDPSQIAGRIQANGQVAIVNGSGVVFMKGSQVDVQSLVVSSANISNKNFMAGQMVFDQPGRPDAKITNAGTITVKATGLAALVAPQVQNAGVINAKLGHVVLAGAEAHTVDLYGDGLMSVDITRQVQKAPNGHNVLVTNAGTIAADGGTILLTASAADGIVTNLVSNTGRLRANTIGDKPGTIVVSAVGGSISIEGAVEANGRASTATGGTITLAATDTVALGSTARVAANGRAGGGTIAIGTTPGRAGSQGGGVPATSARTVTVAAGARIAADGHGSGNGGAIALLATDNTSMAGTITARGGRHGGNGGQVEVSSANKFALTGAIDVGAPAGKPGNILIDPQDITIAPAPPAGANDPDLVAGGGTINATQNPGTDYAISDATINGFTGNVTLQASRNLFVADGVTINLRAGSPPQALTLQAGNNLVVNAASITASGNITLTASSAAIIGATTTGTATIGGTLSSTAGLVRVAADGSAGAVNINAAASGAQIQVAANSVNLAAGLTASATGQSIALSANALTISAPLSTSGGGGVVALAPFTPNTPITIEAGKNTTAGLSLTPADLALLAPAGALARLNLGDVTATPGVITATASSIAFNTASSLNAPTLGLYATGGITQTDTLTAATLTGASGANTALTTPGNRFTTLGRFTAGTNAGFRSEGPLAVIGPITATGSLTLIDPTTLTLNGALSGTGVALQANALTVNAGTTVTANAVAVAPLSGGTPLTIEATKGFTSGLSLTPTEIGRLASTAPGAPALLNLGDTSGIPTAATATAGNIAINTGLTVNAANLGLYTTGTITQTAPLTVATLAGGSNSSTTLLTNNAIGALGSFTTGGPLSLVNAATLLTVTGPVAASGDVLLQSTTGLAVSGNLSSTGALRLRTAGTFTQSAGTVVAGGGDLFVTGIASDLTPTGGTISQTAGTLATTGRLRLYSGADATFTGSGIVGANDIEVIAPLGANTFAGATGPNTGIAAITTGLTPTVTIGTRPSTLRLDGATVTIGRATAADAVELHSTGNTTEPGGSITANTLTGTAGLGANVLPIALPSYIFPGTGSALLDNPTNAVTTLGPYTARNGFTLDNNTTSLTANAAVTVNTGALALRATNLTLNGSVSLTAPRIELAADLITNAPGQLHIPTTGSLAIAPYTPGPYTIGTPPAGGIGISVAQIQTLLPGTPIAILQLGGTSNAPGTAAAVASAALTPADTLTIDTTLNLTGLTSTLALNGRTAVIETPTSAITAGTLTGASNGQFQIDASPSPAGAFYGRTFNNVIPQLAAITAGADSSIATSTSLATLSGTTITAGPANITLTTPGALALNGTLGGGGGIGSVTLQAVTGITQPTGTIQTGTLSGAVGDANPAILTGRDAVLTTPANHIATLGNFTTTQGNFSLIDNQALTVAAGATITGRNVSLTTNGIALAMTINGAIGSCATTASTEGVVTLNSTGPLTITGPGAIVGGERATNLAGTANTVANGAFVESGRSGTPAYDGTITITNGLALQGGTVAANTVLSPGGINQTGGILSAANLTSGAYTLSGGQVYSGTALTLTASALAANDVITAPKLTITATSGFVAHGQIYSAGDIQITLGGAFTQAAGQIYAGGNLTLSGLTPSLIEQTGGVLASANTAQLYAKGQGTVSIAGSLAGQSIQVIEPAATMTFAPTLLAATATDTLPGYTVQFHCPGCEIPTTPPSAVATLAALSLSGTAPSLRIDAGTLTLAAPVTATTVELHSVGATTQTAPITTGLLTGTAGYAVTLPPTGLPTWDTPTTLANATLTNPLNSIATAGPYYTGGSLAITSNVPTFTARDNLVAGGGQSIALTNDQPNGLLVIDGVNAAFLGFGALRGGNFATNPHLNVRGIGTLTQSTVSAAVSPSQVVLTADQLSITAPGPSGAVIDARGGTVSIAPFSPARPLSIDAARIPGTTLLSLGTPDLAHINTLGTTADVGLLGPRTLRLGSTDGTLTNAAGSISLNTTLALTNQAATLALYAQGAITESPTLGSLTIGRAGTTGTLTGAAGGTVTFGSLTDTAPANHFDVLGPFTAGNGLTVSDAVDANAGRTGLLVQGTASAGSGDLGLLDVGQVLAGTRLGGTIAIGTSTTPATLDATGQTLTLIAQNGPAAAPAITEAANSTIRAATLTGRASTNDPAPLAYDIRLNASTTNQIDTLGPFIAGTGPTTAVSAQGAFRLTDAAALTINGQVTAKSVAITANGMTVSGDIGACIIGGTGGDITLASTLGPITVTGGTIGGQSSIALSNDVLQTGGTLNAPTIGIAGSLTENGGTLFGGTVTIAGGATLNSGVLHASSLNATTTYTAGDLYADNTLTVTLPNPTFAGSIASSTALTINAGNLVSTGALYAGGPLTLNAADFSQTAGTIAAHTDLTILATGIATQSGGALEAGGTLLLRASGSTAATATLAGTIAAQTVQLIEPGYALSAIPTTIGGAYAINVGPLANTYHCPGCDTFTARSTATILAPTNPASRPLNLRLDGTTLTLGTLAADNVELHATGPTTQTGSLTALNLTGTAGAPVTLTNPANNILAINAYQSSGSLTLIDQPANQINAAGAPITPTGLTLTGTIQAGPTTGAPIDITTTGPAGALRVNGVLAGSTIALNTSGPITETGTLIADTLTGSTPSAALNTPNQVATLAQFTAPAGFGFVDARDLVVTGKVSATAGNASITANTLTIVPPPPAVDATITAQNVTLRAANVIANGLVGACSIGDVTTGNLTIAATGGTIAINPGAILGGQTSATLTAIGGVQLQGGILNAPTLAIDALALTSGLVFGNTVTLNRPATITGGTLNAATLNTPNGLTFAAGTLNAGNALTLTAGPTLTGQITSGGTLTINGASVADTATLTAANLAINTTGDFQQQSGLIATTGNTTITAGGLITQSASAQIEAGNTILLSASGTGPAAIQGQLAAAQIQILEPGATLSFAPTPFSPSDTHPLRGAATVTLGALTNTFDCPGCLPAALPLSSLSPSSATPGPNRPAALRLDAATLAVGAPSSPLIVAADAIELHSVQTTTQPGGSLETLALTGTANATVTLDSPRNNIASLGAYQVRGDDPTRTGLILVTTPTVQTNAAGTTIAPNGLAVTGTVRAGLSSDPLNASAAAATGNPIALTVNGANQNLQVANTGLLAGNIVTLTSAAGITETGAGRIVAAALTGTAGADVTLATTTSGAPNQGGNQIGTLSSFTTPGAFTLQNSRNLTVTGPVSAQSGLTLTAQSGAGTASAAEGQSAGNLTLAAPIIQGANTTLTAYGDLTGSNPSATGTLALTAGGNVSVSGITAGTLTGNAGQSFAASGSFQTDTSTSAAGGALLLADTSPLNLAGASRSQLGTVITAPTITVTGDLTSAQSIQLHVTGADFTQTGGTIAAATNLLITGGSDTAPLPGAITQQAGLLAAGNTLRLLSTGNALQGAGTIAAPVVQVVSTSGANTFGASQSATVTVPNATVNLAGTLPTFTLSATTTTLSGRPATVRLDGNAISLLRLTAADAVELHAVTNLGELPGGSITANTLQGTAGYAPTGLDPLGLPTYTTLNPAPGAGAAILANTNNILNLGPFEARSGLTLADTPSSGLTITGLVRASNAPLGITLAGPAATLTIADNATLAGSQITLTTPGALIQTPGALILADTLSGTAATAALTPTNGNQIVRLGPFITTGNLTLLDATDVQVTGPVQAGPTLGLTTRGNLDLNGGSLTAGTIVLAATGAITETSGTITANTLTATAAQITARSPGNQVAATGPLSAPGGIALSDASSLNTTAPITAINGPVALQTQGDLTTRDVIAAPSIALNAGQSATLTGTLRANADLTITAGTSLAFAPASQTTATTLTTQSGAATTLAGSIAATSSVNLGSTRSLTLAGTISSPLLTAAAPAITLQGGTITTGGTIQPALVTAAKLPDAPNRSGAPNATSGAFFQAGTSFAQTGPTTITTAPGYPNSTVRISLLSPSTAATVTLASLNAPTTNLILDLQNGAGTGQNIRVANFVVSYAGTGLSPGIGSLDLNAVIVGSQVGTGAASAGTALASPSRTYRINACAVGSINCVVLRPQAVPVGNPLKELSLSFFNDQDDDRDLLVPNISDQGL